MKSANYFETEPGPAVAFQRGGNTPQDAHPQLLMDTNVKPVFHTDYVNEVIFTEHLQLGQVRFSPPLVSLKLIPGQEQGFSGHFIRESLKGEKLMNAQVLWCLLSHNCFIPLDWRNIKVCFWGSLVLSGFNELSVLTLHFMRDNLFYEMKPLNSIFTANYPAAVFKEEALIVPPGKIVSESSLGDDW